ncbi:MAG TPA: hypothetical protein ENH52_01675 [Nitrospirae bacterium]|nr:hypothetical protein [Nitrospirota bacterium]
MKQRNINPQFVICIKNDDYPASLELRKIYQVIPDIQAAEHQRFRIVDESVEDYLYRADYFIPIDLPIQIRKKNETKYNG